MNLNLTNQEVPQRDKGDTGNHAEGYIPGKAPEITTLQHHQRLLRESRESRKTTAETRGKEQGPVTALGTVFTEDAPEKADQETTGEVYSQRCPGIPFADAFHYQGDKTPCCSTDETTSASDRNVLDDL